MADNKEKPGGSGGAGGSGGRVDDIVSVSIPRIRRKQSHVEYVVEVTGKQAVWNIYRRYQQFRDLNSALSRLCSITDNYHTPKGVLPVIPGTSWIRVTSDDVDLVEKRRLHLEIYLQQLLVPSNRFYRDCAELRQFLHQDEMPLTYKNTLSRTVPGLNAPLESDPSGGSVERVFDDDTEEDTRHRAVIASRPASGVESAIDPCIPKMDDWSTSGRGHNEIAAIAGGFTAQPQLGATGGGGTTRANETKESESTHVDGGHNVLGGEQSLIPHEICKNCGHREDIDFDLEEWVPHGTCGKCGQLTEHDLVVPGAPGTDPESPTGAAGAAAAAAAADGGGDGAGGGDSPSSAFAGKLTEEDARTAARRRAELAGVPTDAALAAPVSPNAGHHRRSSSGGGSNSKSPGATSAIEEPVVAAEPAIKEMMQTFDARCDITLADFELITTLGRGTFGKVMKARYKPDGNIYAVKVLSKSMVHQKRMVDYVKEEKAIMAFLPSHPFIVQLHFAFQTDHHLYFVMDFLTGGELYAHMQPLERLPLHAARFYAAELLLAIEHVHKYDVCHRDLKPENIVLSADGHIKLTDFGLARKQFSHKRRFSFVGSAEYLSPEVVRTESQSRAIDWWGFGCMVFEFLTGKTPFHAHTAREVYASILNRQIDFNKPGMTPEAQDLIQKLLDKNPRARLQDPAKIKRHAFFSGINWEHCYQKKMKPPFVPDLTSNDTKYFSKEFTSEWATIPAAASATRASVERLAMRFSNFRRIGDHALPVPAASLNDSSLGAKSGSGAAADAAATTPRSDGPKTPRGDGAAAESSVASASSTERRRTGAAAHSQHGRNLLHGRPLPTADAMHALVSLPDETNLAVAGGRPPGVAGASGGTSPSSASPSSAAAASAMTPSPSAGPQLKHVDPDEFVGVWRLLRVEMVSTLGQVVFPWGAEVAGQLIFTRNGLFSVQICPIKRLKFRGISKPTRDEMCEAFQSYVASFGNFFVVPGKPFIVQRATAALSPSLIGVLQKRYFDLDSDRRLLKLMSPLYRGEGSALVFSSMTWNRVA